MASSGRITMSTQSVDYNNGNQYTRGGITLTNVIGWSVDANGDISFTSISSSDTAGGTWGLCYASAQYYIYLEPQVSYNNGSSWTALARKTKTIDSACQDTPGPHYGYVNTITSSVELINSLGSYRLTGNCLLRFLNASSSAPAPSANNKHAFPDSGYSAATQVPVEVVVDYRPGQDLVGGTWKSHDRTGGHADIRRSGAWVEMKTQEGTGDPPLIRRNGSWVNQAKIGAE